MPVAFALKKLFDIKGSLARANSNSTSPGNLRLFYLASMPMTNTTAVGTKTAPKLTVCKCMLIVP